MNFNEIDGTVWVLCVLGAIAIVVFMSAYAKHIVEKISSEIERNAKHFKN